MTLSATIQLDKQLIGSAAKLSQLVDDPREQTAYGLPSKGLGAHQPRLQTQTEPQPQPLRLRSGEESALALELRDPIGRHPKAGVYPQRALEDGGQPAATLLGSGDGRDTSEGSRGLHIVKTHVGPPAQKNGPLFYRARQEKPTLARYNPRARIAQVAEGESLREQTVPWRGR